MSPWALFPITAGWIAAAMAALYVASLFLRDVSIVDIWWGPGYASIALATALAVGVERGDPRQLLLLALPVLWGLRLGAYLLWRSRGRGEDPRYQAMRRHFGRRFAWISAFTVFGLQGALLWVVSLPVQLGQLGAGPPLGPLDGLGCAVFAGGLAFEALGDLQLARFRADPANRNRVMDRGLWAWTRHPNYFGDCLVHWGIFAVAASAPLGWLSAAGPALMTFLLLRVSGVRLLERSIVRRRPGYADYQRRTHAFLPWPPRRR